MFKLYEQKLLTKNSRSILLAYDQGMEHGPIDFNLLNLNPKYIFDLAKETNLNGLIVLPGIAEKYHNKFQLFSKLNLIIKINAKSNLYSPKDPYSPILCNVARAVSLGAKAIGYTIYPGSKYESKMFKEFSEVVEDAHKYKLPVIAWMYPRGSEIIDELSTNNNAYAARIGLELGADMLKIKYNGDIEGLRWIVANSGKAKVLIAGGLKTDSDESFLKMVKDVIDAGATGLAIGRNFWQHKNPKNIINATKSIVYDNKTIDEALSILKNEN